MHPIAGRCKHCKADLAEARGARPAAAAALPALAGSGTARPSIRKDATPVPKKLGAAGTVATAAAETDQILPPRESGRMPVQKSGGSLLRNWPVLVIILAGIAIAAAVVLMVWPSSSTAKADTRLPPPPAPERMDTNPLPPQGSQLTPPATPKAPGAPDPWAKPDPDDQANIDPADPLKDPFANPRGNAVSPFGSTGGTALMFGVLQHACSRLAACGNSQIGPWCTTLGQAFGQVPAPTCAAAQRCLARIDQLSCDADLTSQSDVLSAMNGIQDCADAMRC